MSTLRIKRSQNTHVPATLEAGELSYTANGDLLYIGRPDGSNTVTAIGGRRYPGTLTANQALVANSTSGIDKVITANLVVTSLWANGTAGSSEQVLSVNTTGGVYWSTVAPGGVTDITSGDGLNQTGTTSVTIDVGAGNGITVNATAVAVLANNGIVANSTGVFVVGGSGLVTNATGVHVGTGNGMAVDADSVRVLAGNTQLVSNSTGVWVVQSNIDHDLLSNFVADEHIAHSGVTLTAGNGLTGGGTIAASRSFAVLANNGIVANSTGVFVTGGSGLVTNSTGVHVGSGNGISVATDSIYAQGGSTLTVNTTGLHVNSSLSITDLTLAGNLTINGTLTTVDTTNLSVNDSIIELARNNGADALDIGFYGSYNDGAARHTGLIWDTSADVFELFANTTVEPSTTLDTGGVGYTRATLHSYLKSGWGTGTFVANSTGVTITANSTYAVALTANSLTLTTPMVATSGGTGQSAYTAGDLLTASNTTFLSKLALGVSGKVLQSNGTAVVYDDVDGGTFVKDTGFLNARVDVISAKGKSTKWKTIDLAISGGMDNFNTV